MIAALLLAAMAQATPESVRREIDALRPTKVAWTDVAWKICPLDALAEARRSKRPVIVWVFLGNPADERC
jgi:hypothetical protein